MTNFDGKISAIFMNIASDTDSKESYKYFKDSVWYLMEEYSKQKLEAFIDDHFPENSLDCKTRVSAKLASMKEGESWSFYATPFIKYPTDEENKVRYGDFKYILDMATGDTTSYIESIMAKSADKTCNQKVSRETSSHQFTVGQTVYALEDNEINKYKIIEIDNTGLYPIVVKDDDDNIEVYALEDVFETVEALLNDLRNKANDL